jgi:glycosyltransferase involved in cell wall biosynthesis
MGVNMDKVVVWYCWFGIGTGYTSVSETVIPALEKIGYKVYVNDGMYGKGEILDAHFAELYSNYFKDMDKVVYEKLPQIMCWSPEFFNSLSGDCKIGWMFLESTRLPEYHRDSCNKMDHMIASSEWVRNVMIDSGVTVPIHVIPPCVDPSKFPHLIRNNDPFTFLHNGFLQERKNPFQTLDGYVNTFPDNGKTKFILFSKYVEEVENIMLAKYGYRKDIEFIFNKTPFTYKEMAELYGRADCYVNISHGEGLSMPDMEAMSTGLPVIGSNWDSRGVFLDNETGWMVKTVGYSKAYTGMLDICGQWMDYDKDEYVRLLKYTAEHPEECRKKGKKASERIRRDFTPERTALALDKMFEEIQNVRV